MLFRDVMHDLLGALRLRPDPGAWVLPGQVLACTYPRTDAAIEEALAAGRRVGVHCGGGRGRTGTLLACLLIARGETPTAAITQVRRLGPGAVETRAQVAAVHAFA